MKTWEKFENRLCRVRADCGSLLRLDEADPARRLPGLEARRTVRDLLRARGADVTVYRKRRHFLCGVCFIIRLLQFQNLPGLQKLSFLEDVKLSTCQVGT
ncbi:MAG TPA: hypothetical protein VLA12_00030, partial [Planctomycetaceae bacterium]|nr:hypothetical protein [Planctomycetaceae bacterium]